MGDTEISGNGLPSTLEYEGGEKEYKEIKDQFNQETGNIPQVAKLTRKQRLWGELFSWPSILFERIKLTRKIVPKATIINSEGKPIATGIEESPRSLQQKLVKELKEMAEEGASTFGLYAWLNLEGLRERQESSVLNAIRFSHFQAIRGDFDSSDRNNLKTILEQVISEGFPWKKDGEIHPLDPRLTAPRFLNEVDVVRGSEYQEGIFRKKQPKPVIVILDGENIEKNKRCLREAISNRAFALIIETNQFEGQPITSFQLICNHEFFDGVPAAYYLRKFLERLGISEDKMVFRNTSYQTEITKEATEETSLVGDLDDLLIEIIKKADERENCLTEEASYQVQSFLLSENLSQRIFDFYERIIPKFGENFISFEAFFQLFILSLHQVDGREIRGGVLKFRQELSKQLGHYDVGDAVEIFRLLINEKLKPEEILTELRERGFVYEKDGQLRFTLYRRGKDNIEKVIELLKKIAPPSFWPVLNDFSKKTGSARAIAGQVMTSFIPHEIGSIKLTGIGGPALTEYQDVAYTIGLFIHKGEKRIIIRRKSRD